MILYDNHCKVCKSFVFILLKFNRYNCSDFIGLQANKGKSILEKYGLNRNYNESVVLVLNQKIYLKSKAVIKIIGEIGLLYKLIYLLNIFPSCILDKMYTSYAQKRNCSKKSFDQ